MTIAEIDDDLIATGDQLKEIDDNKSNCLKDFLKCKPLVDWLREELKGMCGIQSVNLNRYYDKSSFLFMHIFLLYL